MPISAATWLKSSNACASALSGNGLTLSESQVIVAPDYLLAPEYPFPAALKQLHGVASWIADGSLEAALRRTRGVELSPSVQLDVKHLACTGGSAGGNLTVSLALYSMLHPLPAGSQFVSLGLLYPAVRLNDPFDAKVKSVDPKYALSPTLSRLFLDSYIVPVRLPLS
jgi:acetyl esterase/lipase